MMCSACGGDGRIEYGAYRGDDGAETRECRLCGGRRTIETYHEQESGSRVVRAVTGPLNITLPDTNWMSGGEIEAALRASYGPMNPQSLEGR